VHKISLDGLEKRCEFFLRNDGIGSIHISQHSLGSGYSIPPDDFILSYLRNASKFHDSLLFCVSQKSMVSQQLISFSMRMIRFRF